MVALLYDLSGSSWRSYLITAHREYRKCKLKNNSTIGKLQYTQTRTQDIIRTNNITKINLVVTRCVRKIGNATRHDVCAIFCMNLHCTMPHNIEPRR